MGYDPFGRESAIWSAEQNEPVYSTGRKALGAIVGAATLGGIGYGFSRAVDGLQPTGSKKISSIDVAQRLIREVGYASPFQLLNTFRGAEFLSPYVSNRSKQGLGAASPSSILNSTMGSDDVFEYVFDSKSLNKETRIALSNEFRESIADLKKTQGIDLNLNKASSNFEMVYQGKGSDNFGSIFVRETTASGKVGDWLNLNNEARLQEIVPYEASTISKQSRASKINPVALARLQNNGTIGQYDDLNGRGVSDKANQLFAVTTESDQGNVVSGRGRYMPLQSSTMQGQATKLKKAQVLADSLISGAGIFGGFSMQRFNNLLESAADHLPILGKVQKSLSNVGLDLSITPGRPHEMFMNFGIKGAKILGAATAVAEIDHWRRDLGVVGNIGASSITAAAATWGMGRILKDSGTGFKSKFGLGVFAAQMILPGFNQGLAQGLYTTYNNAQLIRSGAGEVTLMNSYRRTVEGLAPGASSIYTGALVGLAAVGASGLGVQPIANKMFDSMSSQAKHSLGFRVDSDGRMPVSNSSSIRQYHSDLKKDLILESVKRENGKYLNESFRSLLVEDAEFFKFSKTEYADIVGKEGAAQRSAINSYIYSRTTADPKKAVVLLDELHSRFEKGHVDRRTANIEQSETNESLIRRIGEIKDKYGGKEGLFSNLGRKLEEFKAQTVHGFFGASMQGETFKAATKGMNYKPLLGRYGSIFAAGVAAHGLLTGGLLGTMETPGELSDIYSGRKMVPIKKSRFWEGGGTPMEGTEIDYYRPHHYVSYMARVHEKAVWGEEAPSPIGQFFLKNFTYEMERRNYNRRPYPVTSGAFEDIPIIGKLLASTVGRVFKEPKLMHASEYMRENSRGEIEFLHDREYGMSYELGGQTPGKPMSPFAPSYVAGYLNYQFREIEGMTGWAKNMVQKAATGQAEMAVQRPVMESAGFMDSINESFWDANIGGGFLTTEPIRRFLPRKRSQVGRYNPIVNDMPSWLPAKFHRGDPYRKIESGEVRLPGSGYEALHPELKGLSPQSYPDIYKYLILGDVADTSLQFKKLQQQLYIRRSKGTMSEKEITMMDQVDQMVGMKSQDLVGSNVHANAYEIPGVSKISQQIYQGGTRTLRKAAAPIEFLAPMGFRPTQKLLYGRDPIEQYEFERMYGTQYSFWDKPFRDWFRPSMYSAANLMGYTGTPEHKHKADEMNRYFDQMEFSKQMHLAEMAGDDKSSMYKHLYAASKTRYGVNPQGSALSIYESLPGNEKKFFDSFAAAQGSDRKRIKEMVSPEIASLYESVWNRMDSGKTSGLFSGGSQQLDEQFLAQRFHGLEQGGFTNGGVMPGADYIGYREDVALDDIKVKYADRLSIDLHDAGMYDKARRDLTRKDYLQGSENVLLQGQRTPGAGMMRRSMHALRGADNSRNPNEMYIRRGGSYNNTSVYYNDNRINEIMSRSRDEF